MRGFTKEDYERLGRALFGPGPQFVPEHIISAHHCDESALGGAKGVSMKIDNGNEVIWCSCGVVLCSYQDEYGRKTTQVFDFKKTL